jgi:hypothetical protein
MSDDFESILLEEIPAEPTPLAAVIEGFMEASGASIEEAREVLAELTHNEKVTQLHRPVVRPELMNVEVQFVDRMIDGWMNAKHGVWVEVLRLWPEDASAPPEGVLVRTVLPDFETILLESIPTEPTPWTVVVREFRTRARLKEASVHIKFFGVLVAWLLRIAKQSPETMGHISGATIADIQVHLEDRGIWQPIDAEILIDLSRRWPIQMPLPPNTVLLKRSFLPARVKEATVKVV